MGIFRDFLNFCCFCCCGDKNEKQEVIEQMPSSDLDGDDQSSLLTEESKIENFAKTLDNIEDKQLISSEKLKNEMKPKFKGGNSAYSLQNVRKRKKKGHLSRQQTNDQILNTYLKLKRCEVIRYLDSGNYSQVYHVRFIPQKRNVALKVINLETVEEHYLNNYLPNELAILKKIPKHHNIISTIEIATRKDRIFIFMEFASKGSLSDWLRDNGVFSETVAQTMFKGILGAICALQKRQIAHRDLKLENILLTEANNPKLTDFSYAIQVNPESPLSTQFCGTLPYFAPELLQRKPYNPLKSDVWSLGICFYIMVNDRLPFPLNDDSLMLQKQLNKEWSFRKTIDLSPELKEIIGIMLEPNVKLRATPFTLKKHQWFNKN